MVILSEKWSRIHKQKSIRVIAVGNICKGPGMQGESCICRKNIYIRKSVSVNEQIVVFFFLIMFFFNNWKRKMAGGLSFEI